MSEDDEQLKPLLLQKAAWSQRELLEHIVDRHFNRISDGYGELPSWQVSPRKGTASECVVELDAHLREHGWYPLLDEDEPFSLTLFDIPSEAHPNNSTLIQIIIWFVSFLFSVTVGASWISYQDGNLDWFDSTVLRLSLTYFAGPLMFALLFSSILRKYIFNRLRVDGGHFLPAISPILFISNSQVLWPFGLLGIFNQRLMPALVWPTRRGMLLSSIVVPLSFLFFGLSYAIIGILLTSNSAPNFSGIPAIIQLNPITHMIATFLITPDELVVRTVWLHPLALAGHSLMTFAWILMMPIPGFPGYRALWAILGSDNMMDSVTEFSLYGLFLLSVVVVLITSGFTPWLFLFGLGVWRMFSEQSKTSSGLITDDSIEIDNGSSIRMFASLFLVLVLIFPGVATVTGYDDWQDGLALQWSEEMTMAVDENSSFILDFDLIGVIARDVNVEVWANPPRPDWNLQVECGEEKYYLPSNCHIGEVDLLNSASITISSDISNNSTALLPTNLNIIIDDGLDITFKTIDLNPQTSIMPNSPHWILEPTFEGLQACTNITFSDEVITGNFSTTALLWSVTTPENGIFTDDSEPQVCLTGPSYGKQTLHRNRIGLILPLSFINDLGEESSWPLRFDTPPAILPVPDDGWILNGKSEQTPYWLHTGSHVAWGEESVACSEDGVREPSLVDGVMTWDAETQFNVRIPDTNEENQMIFSPPSNGVVVSCRNSTVPSYYTNYSTVSGPALALNNGLAIWAWVDKPLDSGIWELINLGNESITIVPKFHHDLDDTLRGWPEVEAFTLSAGESVMLNLTQEFDDEEIFQVAWLSLDEEVGVSGSIRLNFGSWCREGTDLNHSDELIECVDSEA